MKILSLILDDLNETLVYFYMSEFIIIWVFQNN